MDAAQSWKEWLWWESAVKEWLRQERLTAELLLYRRGIVVDWESGTGGERYTKMCRSDGLTWRARSRAITLTENGDV